MGIERGNEFLNKGWLRESIAEGTLGWHAYKTIEKWVHDVSDHPDKDSEKQLEDLKERVRPHLEKYKEYLLGDSPTEK